MFRRSRLSRAAAGVLATSHGSLICADDAIRSSRRPQVYSTLGDVNRRYEKLIIAVSFCISVVCSHAPGAAQLFRNDFDGADRGIVHARRKIELDFALRGRIDVGKRFHQWPITTLAVDVKILQKHRPVAGDIKYAASYATKASIANAKPALEKVKPQSVLGSGGHGDDVVDVAKAMPLVKAAIRDFRQVARKTAKTSAEEIAITRPIVAF